MSYTRVVGTGPSILKDFRLPLRLYQDVQDYWNRKGLVIAAAERKLAFAVLRDWYGERSRQTGCSRREEAA
jgi:beta-glucuronidase